MNSIEYLLVDMLRENKGTRFIYNNIKNKIGYSHFSIESLIDIKPIESSLNEYRINLVLPTLRASKTFGGVTTAIKITKMLMNELNVAGRVIVLSNEIYSKRYTYKIDGFSYSENADSNNVIFAKKEIDIRKNDIIIFTHWRTAYAFHPILNWQKEYYGIPQKKALYLIQDYEPGFYPWSAQYVLAESTYRNNTDSIVALFNSNELFQYFESHGYNFNKKYFFEPVINEELKNYIDSHELMVKREKVIIIYGRPSEQRNAFEILKKAIQVWSKEYGLASEWKVISLGETYKPFYLENSSLIVCGKVTIQEYAKIMNRAYAGISLMISPHPSYPPLEMATFGLKTITNIYDNKDLSGFDDNILCVSSCTPNEIAKQLMRICDNYGDGEVSLKYNESYINGDSLRMAIKEIASDLII